MKKIVFLAVFLIGLGSCQKEKEEISPSQDELSSAVILDSSGASDYLSESTEGLKSITMTEYPVNPRFGRPNSTRYFFKVYDLSGTFALSVKLYNKATGTITYLPMVRTGTYWTLSTLLANNGWYEYRYVYTISHTNISTITYAPLCNTRNTFSLSGISAISWPFGADGSSWNNRTVYVNGTYQKWRGGEETKGTPYHYGYGWDEGTHIGYTERYSDDWNRGAGNQDLGATIRSPLDGYIYAYGTYTTSLGPSTYVSIVQEASDGQLYRFYVGHLQSYPNNIYIGKYIRAGIDQMGTLGSSGASSPHAHTSLRKVTNGDNASVKFYFNAN